MQVLMEATTPDQTLIVYLADDKNRITILISSMQGGRVFTISRTEAQRLAQSILEEINQ